MCEFWLPFLFSQSPHSPSRITMWLRVAALRSRHRHAALHAQVLSSTAAATKPAMSLLQQLENRFYRTVEGEAEVNRARSFKNFVACLDKPSPHGAGPEFSAWLSEQEASLATGGDGGDGDGADEWLDPPGVTALLEEAAALLREVREERGADAIADGLEVGREGRASVASSGGAGLSANGPQLWKPVDPPKLGNVQTMVAAVRV